MDLDAIEKENQTYMTEKLKGVIEPMVAQILLQRPASVRTFMLEWLRRTYNRPAAGGEEVKGAGEDRVRVGRG